MRLSFALVLLTACGESTIWTGLPSTEGVESFIMADGVLSERTIIATSAAEVSPRTVRLEADDARVEVWAYAESLEQLEFEPGPLREDPAGAGLPEPLARWTFDVSAEAWVPDSAPRLLAEVHLEHTTKCTAFDIEAVPLGNGRTFMLDRLPDGRLLHGFSDDNTGETTFRAIDANGVIEMLATSPALYGTSGVVIDDSLWIVTYEGQLFQSPLSDLATYTSSVGQVGIEWQAIAGGHNATGIELYVYSNTGELARVKPDGFEVLEPAQTLGKSQASMIWVGPGEVYAASPVHRTVLHLVNGVVLYEELPLAAGAPIRLEPSTRHGFLAGASSAEIYEGRDGEWKRLATYPLAVGVSAIFEIPDGILFGADSDLREWRELEASFCPPLDAPQATVYMRIAQVGTLIVAGGRPVARGRPSQLALLRPRL